MRCQHLCHVRTTFGQAAAKSQEPAQTPSSSKNAGPSLRASKMLRIFRSLGRTRNVFLLKMNALRRKRTAGVARLNCYSTPGSLRKQLECLIKSLTHRIGDPGIAQHLHDHEIQRVSPG